VKFAARKTAIHQD